jgi:hypothetical protein
MVGYEASLTLRFQEQEEAWVDARTGLELSARLPAALQDRPRLPRPDGSARKLGADLPAAIWAAHQRLERRALAREASLGVHARRALDSELTRAEAYYDATLASIARRHANAPADRARLLDAQAEATRAERARRRREIQDEYRPRHEIRPFRLQLVHLPAFLCPVDVRRGRQSFPFELTWVAAAAEFAPVRCPACGTTEPLVATRDRLGCRACATASRPPVATPAVEATAPRPPVATPAVKAGEPRPENPPRAPGPRIDAEADRGAPRTRAGAPAGRSRARAANRGTAERTGNKLALAFWRCVGSGDRWPRAKAGRDSPLRALYRLYGNTGPQCGIGVPPGHHLDEMVASTYSTEPGAPELTVGTVTAGAASYSYSMSWWMQAGKPVVGEIMPAPHPLALPPLHGADGELALRLRERAPEPTVELDPVARALWRSELGESGLPFTLRCLATWWRVQSRADPSMPPGASAAAVASAVARAAGMRRTRSETATTYATGIEIVASVADELGAELRLGRARGW